MQDPSAVRIGPYTVIREIGRGGMGVVHLARDERLDRLVAVKALPEHVAQQPTRLARFEREARTLASLSHPNVAGIYGVEEQDGQRYLILEFVEGETLGDRLDRGPIALDEAVEIAMEIAMGVEAAHDAGVIHRDLKPDNIKITPEGRVKVLDFGLAKQGESASGSGSGETETVSSPRSPTLPGAVLGTAAYMSPEQARGRSVDKRTDIWSFGVILYEMLTGSSPFAGESASDSIGAVLHKDIDESRLPRDTPEGVRRVLRRCLQRDRSLRLRDIGDARLDLSESRAQGPAGATERTRGRRPGWLGWAAAAAVVVGAVSWQALTHTAAPRAVVRSSILAPDEVLIDRVRVSPDGMRIAFLGEPINIGELAGPRVAGVHLRDLRSGRTTLVPGSEGAFVHRISPDGGTLAFISRGAESSAPERLLRIPMDLSAPAVEVMRVPGEFNVGGSSSWFTWTPAGELAFLNRDSDQIIVFDAGAGRELRRAPLDYAGGKVQLGGLDAPFGDRHVTAYVERFSPDGFAMDVAAIDVESGRVTTVVTDGANLRMLPGGDVIFSRGETVLRSSFDRSRFALTGELRPVENDLATDSHWAHGEFDLSRSGDLVYVPGGVQGRSRRLIQVSRSGEAAPWFDELRAYEEFVAISPDGERLAVNIAGPRGLYELWGSEIDRPRLRRLFAQAGADVVEPVFMPDGEHVVVALRQPAENENARLLVVPFDGGEAPREIWKPWPVDDWIIPRSVSPDGSRVLITVYSGGRASLFEAPTDRADEGRLLVEAPTLYSASYAPTEAPLLQHIATDAGRAEVYVRTLRDGVLGPPIPVTTRGAWSSFWAVDPDVGLCILHFDLEWREWRTPITFENGRIGIGESTPTGRLGDVEYLDRAATRDGTYLVIQRGEDERPATHMTLVQNWGGGAGD